MWPELPEEAREVGQVAGAVAGGHAPQVMGRGRGGGGGSGGGAWLGGRGGGSVRYDVLKVVGQVLGGEGSVGACL